MMLEHVWKDIVTGRNFLIEQGYRDEEITVLMDEPHIDTQDTLSFLKQKPELPTKANILRAFSDLVGGAQEGDRLFVGMSGHGNQQRAESDVFEKDGMDEYFIPCDYYKYIEKKKKRTRRKAKLLDNTIRQKLVDPLPEGVEMLTLVDCCCSGTMMDLPFEAVMKIKFMEKTLQKPLGATKSLVEKVITSPLRRATLPSTTVDQDLIESSRECKHPLSTSEDSVASGPALLPKFRSFPQTDKSYMKRIAPRQKSGIRRIRDKRVIKGKVVSISSCRDDASTFETFHGGLLVTTFARVLAETPNLTYSQLHDEIKSKFLDYHEGMKARFLQQGEPWNDGYQPPFPQFSFSHHYKWNHQFSHFRSLP